MTKQTTTKTIEEEVSPTSPIITCSNYTFYEDEFAPYLKSYFCGI